MATSPSDGIKMVIATRNLQTIKADVRRILFNHWGNENAITGLAIAHLLGFRENRAVRRVIRELISEGCPVASSVSKSKGYFIVENREEVDRYLQHLRDLLIEDATRRRDFKKGAMQHLENVRQGRFW